jgi:hypothetical protein
VDTCFNNNTKSTYILNTKPMGFEEAETFCQTQGGHLVSYKNLREQQEVEKCFVDKASLMPNYHTFYWMGLKTGDVFSVWPNFTWIDHTDAIYTGNYQHWGTSRYAGLDGLAAVAWLQVQLCSALGLAITSPLRAALWLARPSLQTVWRRHFSGAQQPGGRS